VIGLWRQKAVSSARADEQAASATQMAMIVEIRGRITRFSGW
jgi:hypothetical protein